MELEVLEVKKLIETLRGVDTDLRAFGADSHRYGIGPTLSEADLVEFENKHDIVLPADYRLYLQIVGNGNGRPPRPHPYDTPWFQAGAGPGYGIYPLADSVAGDAVSQPFPFEIEVSVPYEPPYRFWEDNIPGTLQISTPGCASWTLLVVQGPSYGSIWEDSDNEHFTLTNRTFIQWMREWVENELRVFAN